jgi:hypothetical protein
MILQKRRLAFNGLHGVISQKMKSSDKAIVILMDIARLTDSWFFQYVGVLINLWLYLFPIFLFPSRPKEFFLDGLKKLKQGSHKCVELRGEYVE